MTILDFTGACIEERLPEALSGGLSPIPSETVDVVSLRSVESCRRLCDEASAAEIRSAIDACHPDDIHWIDSGDFHYLTAFWCARIKVPFDLILFDHHTDMQPAAFHGLLSCGSWLLEMLRHNDSLRNVVILGASESLRCETEAFHDRVKMFSEDELAGLSSEEIYSMAVSHLSGADLYVSIDKDVLSPSEYATNWDQGSMTLDTLCGFLRLLQSMAPRRCPIGADLCGCTDFPSPRDLAADISIVSALRVRS